MTGASVHVADAILPRKARSLAEILSDLGPARAVLVLIAVTALARIAMAAVTGFGTDESYTVANARLFALSYVDYPPLHVWLAGAWAQLWGSESPLLLRLPFIAFFAGSTWMMFRLTAFLFSARAGLWAALALNLAPVFTLAHASWVLPDGPLAFFLLSGATVAARLLFAGSAWPRAGWIAAGALAGLAMLTKYHGVFLLAGVFAYLLTARRDFLVTPWPWLGALTALVLFTPVLLWNADHGWTGLLFQSGRLMGARDLSLVRVAQNIGGQALYLAPWIFAPLAFLWVRALARGPQGGRAWFLALLASGPILFFTTANLFARGLPHWSMPGWLFVFPLLGDAMAKFAVRAPRLARYGTAAAAGIVVVLFTGFATDARNGWLARAMPVADPTLDFVSWSELGPALADRNLVGAGAPAVAALDWFEAGKLNYAVGRQVPVLCLCSDPQQFRYLHDPAHFAGQSLIVATTQNQSKKRSAALARWFDKVEPLPPLVLHRAGRPAIALALFRGEGFHPGGASR